MKKSFLFTFTVLTIFTILVIGVAPEKLTTCSRFLSQKPGKCVKEDCDRMCKQKWPGKYTVGHCYGQFKDAKRCLCSVCGSDRQPP
ncbi:putative defensin-like protein 142 [Arabidopsis thaliana]|uniref:LCR34 n=2 Tax=Arabidopsis TaxID=3701 RepID=A0A178URX4_ARATH|nr:S locus-related glycoprotein 1 binding pollen coat protein [Arabidopsis thaliana x Arabidopsis arenosa]OAO96816.1 LCR34 [Arabidopsis thaliana]